MARKDDTSDDWDALEGYDAGQEYGAQDEPEWTDDDEVRYQASREAERRRVRRRRRQAASFSVIVLLVLGVGVGAAGVLQGWWGWPFGGSTAAEGDPCPQPQLTAALPTDTAVVVLNATENRGLAGKVAEQLTARGFEVTGIGNEEPTVEVPETVQVRFGPASVLEAKAVAAQFPAPAMVDDGRTESTVEVAVGLAFTEMVAPEAAAAAIAPVPATSPTGCTPVTPSVAPAAPPAATP